MRGAGGRPIQVVGRTFGAGGGPGGFGSARSGPARPGPARYPQHYGVVDPQPGGGVSGGSWAGRGVGISWGGRTGWGATPPPLPAGW